MHALDLVDPMTRSSPIMHQVSMPLNRVSSRDTYMFLRTHNEYKYIGVHPQHMKWAGIDTK